MPSIEALRAALKQQKKKDKVKYSTLLRRLDVKPPGRITDHR